MHLPPFQYSLASIELLCITTDVGFVSADVLRLFFDFLFDKGIIRKEVFLKWASAAALQGKDVALTSVAGFLTRLREPECSSATVTQSSSKVSEEKSLWSNHSRTPAEAFKQRSLSL